MIKSFIHNLYVIFGTILNNIRLLFWRLRDKISPPKSNSILFVAHPDDDTLFFHTYIKKHKPYVVLLSDGWSLKRFKGFAKVMKKYGVKYRAYNLHSRDKRVERLEKFINESLKIGEFSLCATHNETGEYGHEMHIRVHNAVKKYCKAKLLVPVLEEDIEKYPLSTKEFQEKTAIFKKYYTTELFVLDMYNKWVVNEKLV